MHYFLNQIGWLWHGQQQGLYSKLPAPQQLAMAYGRSKTIALLA